MRGGRIGIARAAVAVRVAVGLTAASVAVLGLGEAPSPEGLFETLEQRLLVAGQVRISFTIKAEGAITANLKGTVELGSGNVAEIRAKGRFGGGEVNLALVSDGETVRGGNEAIGQTFERKVPAAFREAIVLGVTRMGALHNLARLFAGVEPDRANGGVRDWVEVVEIIDGGDGTVETIGETEVRAIQFGIHINGRRAASAGLWLDPEGLPRKRKQTVSFGSKEMHVEEVYHVFSIQDAEVKNGDAPVPPATGDEDS